MSPGWLQPASEGQPFNNQSAMRIIVKNMAKTNNFQMLPETTNFRVSKINTWCNDNSILLFFGKVISKSVGLTELLEGQVEKQG